MSRLVLGSGLTVHDPFATLLAFCSEEHAYYDGVPSVDPDRIDPVDVMVTVAMNSFVNSADRVRSVHRGLAESCDPILAEIPEHADLRSFDLQPMERLLDAACRTRGVLIAVATKVLHRKRRSLIPMLDSVVVDYYRAAGVSVSGAALDDGRRAGAAVMPVVEAFREDLTESWERLESVAADLVSEAFTQTPLRLLELLIWTETEPKGYYRDG